jgi:hypothetical protein
MQTYCDTAYAVNEFMNENEENNREKKMMNLLKIPELPNP